MKLFFVFAVALIAQNASAERMYQLEGKITRISGDSLTVQSGSESFELKRDPVALEIPKDAKVGDRVTVFYSMDARKLVKKPKQEAGEKSPPQKTMQDDRLFYDARNGSVEAPHG
jgi:hypothetical protein